MRESTNDLTLYLLWVVSMTGFAYVLVTVVVLGSL